MSRRAVLAIVVGTGLSVAFAFLFSILLSEGRPAFRALDPEAVAALEAEIRDLRNSLEARSRNDTLLHFIEAEEGDILLATRTELVQEIARWATERYLDRVDLHLAPDAVVRESEEVRTKVGPISVRAGEWRLNLTVNTIHARLSVDSLALAIADSSSMSAWIEVGVSDARGQATIDFVWDAGGVGSVVCRDFEFHETLGGTVASTSYRLQGGFSFEATPEGIVARPQFGRPEIRVRPRADPAAWQRVSDVLDEQNNIFRCGIALKPDDLLEKLDDLLAEGFDVELPDVLFRPILLPARVEDRVQIRDELIEVENAPLHLHLTGDAIWYGSRLRLRLGRGTAPDSGGVGDPGAGSGGADRRRGG